MKRKTFMIALAAVLAVVAMEIAAGTAMDRAGEKHWDTIHGMANANISWEQTWYSGAWGR